MVGKNQILMDGWKKSWKDMKETIHLSNKACASMWNYVDELLEQFKIPVMDEITQVGPIKLRITKVEDKIDNSKQAIEKLIEVNKDILSQYLIQPIKQASYTNDFENKIHRDLKNKSCL
jgi:uncharacterized protein Yka (UPF0111/DUF47 family)